MDLVKITPDCLSTANYALFHNRIPICQGVEVTNISDHRIEGLKVSCSGELIRPYETAPTGIIAPGETMRISPFNIVPDAEALASLTERKVVEVKFEALCGEEVVGHTSVEIEMMPYDHWTGTTVIPQTIASFITPNNPAINELVIKSAAILKERTGKSSFIEYQSGNVNDVRTQVAAIFAAIHDEGIVYRGMPASYEEVGQRITMPDQVLASKVGNCIELTLLMASVLEAVGINSVIIFQSGHAYLGVWLVDDSYPCSVCDDASFIEKKCSRGIDEMLVLECTQTCEEKTSFESAVSIAEHNLADHSLFRMFVDVRRCRLERIFPLPTRMEKNGAWTFDTEGIEHDYCGIDLKQHDRYDLSRYSTGSKELTKFDIWERKLLDFSLRNSMLNLSMRRKAIQFVSFDVNKIEDHLQDGKEYCIMAKPGSDLSVEMTGGLIRSKLYDKFHDLIVNDIDHHILHTYLPEGETKSTLKNIYRSARNAIEETGANSLFLAVGVLRWYETEHSTNPRYAPLLLLPVEMVYKKGDYFIRTRDEEITLNITLMEFLRQNYDITVSGLDPLPTDDSGVDVSLIFAIVRDALKSQKRWDVEEESLLGIFSFSKFLMWNDVHSHRDLMEQNKIISSLLANRLTWTPATSAMRLEDIDRHVSPADIATPVAVDSSQMAAVIEGGNGNSFILYGPPGTGKSQTITNLIANALFQGKRVLFVAEKMAALSVVQKRLAKIGLDPFCLELHSNKSTKRHVLEQLEKALKVTHIVSPADYALLADKIFADRKEMIAYINALHAVNPVDGLSLYDCIIRHEAIEADPMPGFRYDARVDALLAAGGTREIDDMLGGRLDTVAKLIGHPSEHPLKGLHITRSMLTDSGSLTDTLRKDSQRLAAFASEADDLSGAAEIHQRILRDNSPEILTQNPDEMRDQWRAVKAKWFIPRFFARRKFMKRLREFNKLINKGEVEPLLEDLIAYRRRNEKITDLHNTLQSYFEKEYTEDEVPAASFLNEASARLDKWSAHSNRMRDWLHWSELSDSLRKNGMECVVEAIEDRGVNLASVRDAYLKALFRHKAESGISSSEALSAFEGMLFDDKIEAYRRMTEEFQLLTQKELYARLASRVPRVTDNANSGSEIGLINRNISNGGRGLSLRDLFDQLPTLMPRLCPCMLMSPMSVAQFIDLKAEKFDLVVFDEASQMPTSEAVGAVARGKMLIVVGDPKQMPPTSFFSSSNVDVEEASIDDMESILEDCRTLEMPSLQLSWHYRSRHESLIAFSNNEYYEGSLITFPSVDDRETKVHFNYVKGQYDKGGKRFNRAEAEAIVDEIERRLRDEELRQHSIGVIAFSVMQQGLIEDILQDRLDGDKALQEAASGMYEPIFVKNLENVQGDERDVILFSIGYGPDKDGKISMNFGPLNNVGGERRLNVAVSRARQEMYIFSTLRAADIDLRRSKARGVEGLKHFLQYAESQILPAVPQSGLSRHHSLIADSIAEELRSRGYNVTTDVGKSQFRIDVAVEDPECPGKYRLGILLDGENYRDTHTTRDREVVQPSVLSSLSWKVMRVWSVDWFNNPDRVITRIIETIGEKDAPQTQAPAPQKLFDISQEEVQPTVTRSMEYKPFAIDPRKALAMSDHELVKNIISAEQPVTFMGLCRRVNALRGGGRVTPSMQKAFRIYTSWFFEDESGALWLSDEESKGYKWYRPDSGRDIADIPDVEIANAIVETLEEQLALNDDTLMLLAAKKLGFTRRGVNVDAAFRRVLEQLKSSGLLETVGDNIRLKSQE